MNRILLTLFLTTACSFFSSGQNEVIGVDKDIQLIRLKDSVFMHVTWHDDKDFGRFSSNGMIIINEGKALMIDTPADNDKTERLVRYLYDSMQVVMDGLIIGHFHNDCLGGLEFVKSIGVKSIANSRTIEKCIELNLPVPEISFGDSLVFKFGGREIKCKYFGAGHTVDNITVWLNDSHILFGGCLIKDFQSTSLGNLSDAVVEKWQETVECVVSAYPQAQIVIPGHGKPGGTELLGKTIDLVKKEKSKLN